MSRVEGGGPIDNPPPKASCNYFFQKASRVKDAIKYAKQLDLDLKLSELNPHAIQQMVKKQVRGR